jgi:hypothetical protein
MATTIPALSGEIMIHVHDPVAHVSQIRILRIHLVVSYGIKAAEL